MNTKPIIAVCAILLAVVVGVWGMNQIAKPTMAGQIQAPSQPSYSKENAGIIRILIDIHSGLEPTDYVRGLHLVINEAKLRSKELERMVTSGNPSNPLVMDLYIGLASRADSWQTTLNIYGDGERGDDRVASRQHIISVRKDIAELKQRAGDILAVIGK